MAPDDGLIHGQELDAAMSNAMAPPDMGICLSALQERVDSLVDVQLEVGMALAGHEDYEAAKAGLIRGVVGAAFTYGIAVGMALRDNRVAP